MVKEEVILFIVMFFIAFSIDPMNMMVYSIKDIYVSKSLLITSVYMASTMLWGHQIVHYFTMGHFNKIIFFLGIFISLTFLYIMRQQLFIQPNDWLKEMIKHHSTAITTTSKLINNNNLQTRPNLYKLANNILETQQNEILIMKSMLK